MLIIRKTEATFVTQTFNIYAAVATLQQIRGEFLFLKKCYLTKTRGQFSKNGIFALKHRLSFYSRIHLLFKVTLKTRNFCDE